MKNNKYSIRRISVGIVSIIIGLNVGGVDSVKDEMSTDNKVIIDENGVRPVVEPISPKNPSVESINKPTVKPAEKPNKKPENKPSIKPAEKPIEKPGSKLSEKTEVNPPVKQTEKIIEKPTSKPTVKPDRQPLVESKEDKTSGKHDGDKFQAITDKEK